MGSMDSGCGCTIFTTLSGVVTGTCGRHSQNTHGIAVDPASAGKEGVSSGVGSSTITAPSVTGAAEEMSEADNSKRS